MKDYNYTETVNIWISVCSILCCINFLPTHHWCIHLNTNFCITCRAQVTEITLSFPTSRSVPRGSDVHTEGDFKSTIFFDPTTPTRQPISKYCFLIHSREACLFIRSQNFTSTKWDAFPKIPRESNQLKLLILVPNSCCLAQEK